MDRRTFLTHSAAMTAGAVTQALMARTRHIQSRFSPRGGCEAEIIRAISGAKRSIRMAAYQLRSEPIRAALIEASRLCDVRLILDGDQQEAHKIMVAADVECRLDHKHKIFHHKFIVFDANMLLTGSFNYSASAEESNAENLLTITGDTGVVSAHLDNWTVHWEHSV